MIILQLKRILRWKSRRSAVYERVIIGLLLGRKLPFSARFALTVSERAVERVAAIVSI